MSNFNSKIMAVDFVPGEGNIDDMLSITFEDNTRYNMPLYDGDDKFTVANKLNVLALAIVTDQVLSTHNLLSNIPDNRIH